MRHRLVLVPHEAGYGNMGIFDLFRQIESGSGSGLQGKLTWLVVGLGNIGLEYENTRHNAGFMAVEQLAQTCGGDFRQMKFRSDCGEAMVGGVRCLLMKPTTYMNNSGEAVRHSGVQVRRSVRSGLLGRRFGAAGKRRLPDTGLRRHRQHRQLRHQRPCQHLFPRPEPAEKRGHRHSLHYLRQIHLRGIGTDPVPVLQ